MLTGSKLRPHKQTVPERSVALPLLAIGGTSVVWPRCCTRCWRSPCSPSPPYLLVPYSSGGRL
jgi:hypothetical protein